MNEFHGKNENFIRQEMYAGFNILSLNRILSLDCNLACKYCYESGMKGRHYMSSKTNPITLIFGKNRNALTANIYPYASVGADI